MRMSRRKEPSYEGDPLIPIMNLVCMLIPLLLYGAVFVRYTTLDVSAPNTKPINRNTPTEDTLELTVMITDQGFHFKVNANHRLPWMVQAGTQNSGSVDIPKKNGEWDYATLEMRLREIKKFNSTERRIVLGAEDNIDFQVLVTTMDYARGDPADELFPQVTLTRGVG